MYEQAHARYVRFNPYRILSTMEDDAAKFMHQRQVKSKDYESYYQILKNNPRLLHTEEFVKLYHERWTEIEIEMLKASNYLLVFLIEEEEYTVSANAIILRLLAKRGWKHLIGINKIVNDERGYEDRRDSNPLSLSIIRSLQLVHNDEELSKYVYDNKFDLPIVAAIRGELPKVLQTGDFNPNVLIDNLSAPIPHVEDLFELDDWHEKLEPIIYHAPCHISEAVIKKVIKFNRVDIMQYFRKSIYYWLEDCVTAKQIENLAQRGKWEMVCTICLIICENKSYDETLIEAAAYVAADKERIDILKRLLPPLSKRSVQNVIDYNCSDKVAAWLAGR